MVSAQTLYYVKQQKKQFEHVSFPKPEFSGDNAAMVGAACYYEIKSGVQPSDPYHLNILPRSEIK